MQGLYLNLLQKPVFTWEDVSRCYEQAGAGRTALKKLLKSGDAVRIRRNLYTCVDRETQKPVANKYQIGCALSPTAYLSHHSALEYLRGDEDFGHEVFVSSESGFTPFSFEDCIYYYAASKCREGVEELEIGVRATNVERAVIDCIKDMEKFLGLWEVIPELEMLSEVREDLLADYLKYYQNQFLYQKTGFLLLPYQEKWGLSDPFFQWCRKKAGKSKRYLVREDTASHYENMWKLMVPDYLYKLVDRKAADDRMFFA